MCAVRQQKIFVWNRALIVLAEHLDEIDVDEAVVAARGRARHSHEDAAGVELGRHRRAARHAPRRLILEHLDGRSAIRAGSLQQVLIDVPLEDRAADQRHEEDDQEDHVRHVEEHAERAAAEQEEEDEWSNERFNRRRQPRKLRARRRVARRRRRAPPRRKRQQRGARRRQARMVLQQRARGTNRSARCKRRNDRCSCEHF